MRTQRQCLHPARTLATLTALAGLALAGCGTSSLSVADACKPARDQQDVTVIGYLTVPTMVAPCSTHCSVAIADAPGYAATTIRLRVPVGTGPLSMKPLPPGPNLSTVSAPAFTVVDSDGQPRPIGSRVQVTGRLTAAKRVVDDVGTKIEILTCELIAASLRPAR